MTRTTKYRLLLFAALFHLFADVAGAGGAILCVGPNDHRAVEPEHVSTLGCVSGSFDGLVLSDARPARADCTDSPLHSEAEIVSSCNDGSDLAPQPGPSATVSQIGSPISKLPLRAFTHAPEFPPGLRAHRTTVLLL